MTARFWPRDTADLVKHFGVDLNAVHDQRAPTDKHVTVIYGPPASGKTRYAEQFRKHYKCVRIVDEGLTGHINGMRPGDLVLAQHWDNSWRESFSVHAIPIAGALKAIGVRA